MKMLMFKLNIDHIKIKDKVDETQNCTTKTANFNIPIRISNDTLIVVTQEIDKNLGPLSVGDKVRALNSSNGTTRVQLSQ